MIRPKVFLGVSGGIDSFASALILKNMGYEVIGVHLLMEGKCKEDIPLLSKRLGIDIIIHDASKLFQEKVINNFVNTYIAGGVPSPCVECNNYVKWESLRYVADNHGGGFISTGHYCRITKIDSLFFVQRGVDNLKDQSYYLWHLGQDILSRAIFPLGELTKTEVRSFVLQHGFQELSKRNESMGLCFMGGKKLREYLLEKEPSLKDLEGGNILDHNGKVIGQHSGYPFYTLAQKKGLTLDVNKCITSVNKDNNTLLIGCANDLFTKTIHVKDVYATSKEMLISCLQLTIKVRGIGVNPKGYATININGTNATIILQEPAWAVTSGQPVVFYSDDIVLGGGVCY
ncbi:MAG: tRNA 2-thiouridine(34) synthase MnmA [Rikenellaceae bacterium]